MDDDAMQLMEERCTYLFGIGGNCINRNINIAIYTRARGIIKGDDIRIIVVLQELAIDGEDLLVVAEDIIEFAYGVAILGCGTLNPLLHLVGVDGRHGDIVRVEGDHGRVV